MATLNFLINTILGTYILILLLRVWMQFVKADFYNPASQFIVKVTQPIVAPLRRILPSMRSIDTASIVLALILSIAKYALLEFIVRKAFIDFEFVFWGVASLVKSFGRLIFWLILIRAIMSWISQGRNSIDHLLIQLTEPLMTPIRRFLPPMAGIDFSAMVVFFILYGLNLVGLDIIGPSWAFL